MNKNYHKNIQILTTLLLSIFMLQACTPTNQNEIAEPEETISQIIDIIQPESELIVEEPSSPDPSAEKSDIILDQNPEIANLQTDLTEDEIASLIYMREEEKLAKDVYLGLFELWGTPIFQNIANSEQTHTDAVKGLLDTFGIPDPADTSPAGVFINRDLQNLYDELMAAGAQSLGDALKVGTAIEEIDILDLKSSLEFTKNQEIQRVYENLLRGSENHLRSFTSNLERQTGENYQPQYLSQEDYDTIIGSSTTRGGRGNGNRP